MPLDIINYKDFLNPKYRNKGYVAIVPREYLLEPYNKLLKVIQRYFTVKEDLGGSISIILGY